MRIAITANGPGEIAGWVRPFVRALYDRDPGADVHLFLVPDDFATGRENSVARSWFPRLTVHEPRDFPALAYGMRGAELPKGIDVVHYMGGDLMHAVALHKRLGGVATTYKFSRPKYRDVFACAFAVDESNVSQLRGWGTPAARIERVGNLAVDGALLDAQAAREDGVPEDGILIMPGSRGHEVEQLIPFFFTAAMRLARERPEVPIAFGISPFTSLQAVRAAIEAGGDPRMYARSGTLLEENGRAWLLAHDGRTRIAIVRHALAAAAHARLVLTIPGTKTIEVAALGKPIVAVTPLNAPEKIAINGPLTYLDRIPLAGVPLKRAVVLGVSKRFVYHTQPNIDAGEAVVCEVHGTLTPGRVARIALERFDDLSWIERTGERLGALYAPHAGAAQRMAARIAELAA